MNSHHRRVISVRLRLLENYCRSFLELFRPLESSLMRRIPLPEEKAEEIQRLVTEMNARISNMQAELGLESHTLDARRQAAALVSTMGVDLEELYPRYLKGYGEVPPLLAEYLEERLGDCLGCIARMHQALGDARPGPKRHS
jgi:hypothetical protein